MVHFWCWVIPTHISSRSEPHMVATLHNGHIIHIPQIQGIFFHIVYLLHIHIGYNKSFKFHSCKFSSSFSLCCTLFQAMATFHVEGKSNLTILVGDSKMVQITKQCLAFNQVQYMYLIMLFMQKTKSSSIQFTKFLPVAFKDYIGWLMLESIGCR